MLEQSLLYPNQTQLSHFFGEWHTFGIDKVHDIMYNACHQRPSGPFWLCPPAATSSVTAKDAEIHAKKRASQTLFAPCGYLAREMEHIHARARQTTSERLDLSQLEPGHSPPKHREVLLRRPAICAPDTRPPDTTFGDMYPARHCSQITCEDSVHQVPFGSATEKPP